MILTQIIHFLDESATFVLKTHIFVAVCIGASFPVVWPRCLDKNQVIRREVQHGAMDPEGHEAEGPEAPEAEPAQGAQFRLVENGEKR